MIEISGTLNWSKTLIELLFNPCGEFRLSPDGPVSQFPHLHAGAPGLLSDLVRSVRMLNREWGAESNGKLPHLVPEFAVEHLPLSRTVALVSDLPTHVHGGYGCKDRHSAAFTPEKPLIRIL